MLRSARLDLAAATLTLTLTPAAFAWDAHGHRTITYLALAGLPEDAPAWLREPAGEGSGGAWHRIAEQSNEADRWRGTRMAALGHANSPDHFIDVELLEQFGLTLETVPPLRGEYLRAMAVSKHVHPELVDPYDPARDPDRSKEWPGFLPHAITEHYAKLRASFSTLRILEELGDPARAHQVEMARMNVEYHMGMLAHFVADGAQPLHTTKHFNGWAGDNPEGYTTDRRFHAYIDGGVVDLHGITYDVVLPRVRFGVGVNADDPWDDVIAYIARGFEKVEPLYRLQRDGGLQGEEGRELIIGCFADAASVLSALYWAAYVNAEPTERDIHAFVRYNNLDPALLPEAPGSAGTPAPAGPAPAERTVPAGMDR